MKELRLTKAQLEAWTTFSDPCWLPFKAAWFERGLVLPPEGEAEDEPDWSLRSRLWQIASARPNDLARWIRGAPSGRDVYRIVDHVFRRWIAMERSIEEQETALLATEADAFPDRDEATLVMARIIAEPGIDGTILSRHMVPPKPPNRADDPEVWRKIRELADRLAREYGASA